MATRRAFLLRSIAGGTYVWLEGGASVIPVHGATSTRIGMYATASHSVATPVDAYAPLRDFRAAQQIALGGPAGQRELAAYTSILHYAGQYDGTPESLDRVRRLILREAEQGLDPTRPEVETLITALSGTNLYLDRAYEPWVTGVATGLLAPAGLVLSTGLAASAVLAIGAGFVGAGVSTAFDRTLSPSMSEDTLRGLANWASRRLTELPLASQGAQVLLDDPAIQAAMPARQKLTGAPLADLPASVRESVQASVQTAARGEAHDNGTELKRTVREELGRKIRESARRPEERPAPTLLEIQSDDREMRAAVTVVGFVLSEVFHNNEDARSFVKAGTAVVQIVTAARLFAGGGALALGPFGLAGSLAGALSSLLTPDASPFAQELASIRECLGRVENRLVAIEYRQFETIRLLHDILGRLDDDRRWVSEELAKLRQAYLDLADVIRKKNGSALFSEFEKAASAVKRSMRPERTDGEMPSEDTYAFAVRDLFDATQSFRDDSIACCASLAGDAHSVAESICTANRVDSLFGQLESLYRGTVDIRVPDALLDAERRVLRPGTRGSLPNPVAWSWAVAAYVAARTARIGVELSDDAIRCSEQATWGEHLRAAVLVVSAPSTLIALASALYELSGAQTADNASKRASVGWRFVPKANTVTGEVFALARQFEEEKLEPRPIALPIGGASEAEAIAADCPANIAYADGGLIRGSVRTFFRYRHDSLQRALDVGLLQKRRFAVVDHNVYPGEAPVSMVSPALVGTAYKLVITEGPRRGCELQPERFGLIEAQVGSITIRYWNDVANIKKRGKTSADLQAACHDLLRTTRDFVRIKESFPTFVMDRLKTSDESSLGRWSITAAKARIGKTVALARKAGVWDPAHLSIDTARIITTKKDVVDYLTWLLRSQLKPSRDYPLRIAEYLGRQLAADASWIRSTVEVADGRGLPCIDDTIRQVREYGNMIGVSLPASLPRPAQAPTSLLPQWWSPEPRIEQVLDPGVRRGFVHCSKCGCLYLWAASGRCAGGGVHGLEPSPAFVLGRKDSAWPQKEGVNGWRDCDSCSAVYLPVDGRVPECQGRAGGHGDGSERLFVPQATFRPPPRPEAVLGWSRCSNCSVLFLMYPGARVSASVCVNGTPHVGIDSGTFYVPYWTGEN